MFLEQVLNAESENRTKDDTKPNKEGGHVMRRRTLIWLLIVGLSGLLMSCAAQKPAMQDWKTAFSPKDLNPMVRSGDYGPKVDNFHVLLDASGSMAKSYNGKVKLNYAKDLVSRMNQTIPDLNLQGALRMFGRTSLIREADTKLLYGLTTYTKAGLEGGLNLVGNAAGESPMKTGIGGANMDLKNSQGNIALIIVSDGDEEMMDHRGAIQAAANMKRQYGDRLCIYTILIGKDPKGKNLLKKIADAGQCGFSTSADTISSSGGMALFVEKVFLRPLPKKPVPPPPPPRPKEPKDTDNDGVYDHKDRCPDTPLGAKVNMYGCWILDMVHFDTDKSKIKPQYFSVLNDVISVMNKNPELKMAIQGHTDSRASAKYNRGLSMRRAKAVQAYFMKNGISAERLTIVGYGLTQPIASNNNDPGRALNRRVELHPFR
jgi:OOP family OmpA-OmpF porin